MVEAVRTSETSVDNYFTRQYIPEDASELHTRRRENLKSQIPGRSRETPQWLPVKSPQVLRFYNLINSALSEHSSWYNIVKQPAIHPPSFSSSVFTESYQLTFAVLMLTWV
jgi:hypothetical protein